MLGSEAVASKLLMCSGTKPTMKKVLDLSLDLNLQENGGCSRSNAACCKKTPTVHYKNGQVFRKDGIFKDVKL